jgi:hypothetical protein
MNKVTVWQLNGASKEDIDIFSASLQKAIDNAGDGYDTHITIPLYANVIQITLNSSDRHIVDNPETTPPAGAQQ